MWITTLLCQVSSMGQPIQFGIQKTYLFYFQIRCGNRNFRFSYTYQIPVVYNCYSDKVSLKYSVLVQVLYSIFMQYMPKSLKNYHFIWNINLHIRTLQKFPFLKIAHSSYSGLLLSLCTVAKCVFSTNLRLVLYPHM